MNSITLNSLALNARKYWPVRIVEDDGRSGFRIGGLPPVGVTPNFVNKRTHYFGTFPITDGREQEMSIFYSFEYLDFENPYFFARHLFIPLGAKSKVIECVFHKPSRRAKRSKIASELHAYSLSVGEESMNEPEYVPEGVSHKIGGIAYSCEQCARARDAAADLINTGYIHVLDFGYPGRADCSVKGEWPFANYRFHLYLRKSGELYEYQAMLV